MTVLTKPPFAGSRRIEKLETMPSRWFKVTDTDKRVALLSSLTTIPRIQCEIPVVELLRPWSVIHAACVYERQGFAHLAAAALQATEMPIRVAVDEHGRPSRSRELLQLRRPDSPEVRIRLGKDIRNLADHVLRHLADDKDDDGWALGLRRQAATPIRGHHLRTAARYYRSNGYGQTDIDSLAPALWPLVEAYTATTVEALRDMLAGDVVHLARQPNLFVDPTRHLTAYQKLGVDPLDMPAGTEQLMTLSPGRLHCVARTVPWGDGPLLWRSTYPLAQPRPGERDKLDEVARYTEKSADFDCVRHTNTR